MPRYFIEVSYKGTHYSGFQVQQNANTVQAEVEKALRVYYKKEFNLTGSSRTDAGVHAMQNFFHFDTDTILKKDTYNLNAILPADIVVKSIREVKETAHCRFDALTREYNYHIYQQKNPFLQGAALYIPYHLDIELMQAAAAEIMNHTDFSSFAKRNTQVSSFLCKIHKSEWIKEDDCIIYKIKANRFLRGMVKGLVGTMLSVGKKKITLNDFKEIIAAGDCTKADFSVSPDGLILVEVAFL